MQSNLEPNVIRIIRGHKSNINTQKAKHCKNWNVLIPLSIVPNSCKIVNIFKENNDKLYMLAKNRLNAERRAGLIETAIYQIKINYIFENKLIKIDGSIAKLNTVQDIVSMEDVKKILKDTIEERYDLKTP